jgi:hypothetical protein
MFFMGPSGVIALIAGWVTTEVGRQPYTVYGLLRTADSVSPIDAPAVAVSLMAFVVCYFIVFRAGMIYLFRELRTLPSTTSILLLESNQIRSSNVKGHVYDGCTMIDLPLVSAIMIVLAVLTYPLLDGFSLSLGILLCIKPLLLPLVGTVFVFIVLLSTWTPFLDDCLMTRWFVFPNVIWLAPVPALVVGVTFFLARAMIRGAEQKTFYLAKALFVVIFIGFGISTYPYIVLHGITIGEAAAPDSSFSFLLVGTLILLPLIIAYTVHSY